MASYTLDNEGKYRFIGHVTEDEIMELASTIVERRFSRGAALTNPNDARQYIALQLAEFECEVFCCLFLDTKHRVISFEQMFNGTIDGASVYPREVVKAALKCNAAAVILAHNHPSGVPEASAADQALTRRLQEALSLVDIRVLDHIIVGALQAASMAEMGFL